MRAESGAPGPPGVSGIGAGGAGAPRSRLRGGHGPGPAWEPGASARPPGLPTPLGASGEERGERGSGGLGSPACLVWGKTQRTQGAWRLSDSVPGTGGPAPRAGGCMCAKGGVRTGSRQPRGARGEDGMLGREQKKPLTPPAKVCGGGMGVCVWGGKGRALVRGGRGRSHFQPPLGFRFPVLAKLGANLQLWPCHHGWYPNHAGFL